MSVIPAQRPARHTFEQRAASTKTSKSDINYVIMDYLVNEGYPAAARKFAAEANLHPAMGDYSDIEDRMEIKAAILAGNIQVAIEKLNELNCNLLDQDESLHFALLRLHLIELIRKCNALPNGDLMPVITFAQTELAPRASTPEFVRDLECTMALLLYTPDKHTPAMAKLLDPELRRGIAARVNVAILGSQGHQSQTRLKSLVKLKTWAEKRAREKGHDLPDKLSIWHDSVQSSRHVEDSMMGGVDSEPVVAAF